MSLRVGIVGMPNAGKSTLFNALLKKQQALAANYPFATIEPNVGIVPVPDTRLTGLQEVIEQTEGKTPPIVPATVEFVDIAGLVAGASQGEGLGNKFLAHIREVDLICQVTRYFQDADVIHVAGTVDPQRDVDIITTELILADQETLKKQPAPKGSITRRDARRYELIQSLLSGLDAGNVARNIIPQGEDRELVSDLHLLTMKPVLLVHNVGEGESIDSSDSQTIAISAKIEAELAELNESEQKEYLQTLGYQQSGLERLITKAYELLGLMSFLTCGIKEVRAWTIPVGTKAPDAAGVIHTDFTKHFIKADVVSYGSFIEYGGWVKARAEGKVRMEGREYVMQDGDVVEFKVNA